VPTTALDDFTAACAASAQRVAAHLADAIDAASPTLAAVGDLVDAWAAYYGGHPGDFQAARAGAFELDPDRRAAAAAAVRPHHAAVMASLVARVRQAGALRDDVDDGDLVELFVTVLPHLALAPLAGGVPTASVRVAIDELLGAVAAAFGPPPDLAAP
jgi:AcrR family transcriptional regulator